MNGDKPRQFKGSSEFSLEHAISLAAASAARSAKRRGVSYADTEFEIIRASVVLSNPHIKEFRATISGG